MTESFVYDPWSPYSSIANDVLLDFEDGALVRRWLHGPEVDEPLAYERYAGTTAGGTGTALELFRNRLGSVILAVSVSTGAVAAEYDYDSFGQRTLVQGTEEVRYGFTSREHDARTGLIHYRARAYDPLTGRFLQRDPIGFASGDLNLYAYVENDPYNWTDPSGLTAVDGAATIGRSAGMSTGLSGLFGGVLNLVNAIRASLVSAAAIGTGVAMNQSGDGERGIGDNGGPPLDDDTERGDLERPYNPEDVHFPEGRAEHILDGDRTGGGHRAGTGRPGKTEFPPSMSDDEILGAIEEVAKNGDVRGPARTPGGVRVGGVVDGIEIEVVVGPDGGIRTGWPVSGPGVVRNPR
ncbi:RHS repeat-associated core domain-containing protein [Rhodophyticola porphyridii]|uniref:RHS repeat-associated core domain-containing protein n=1 Tax=Rhodophyticola porphyridii TaxID=1852017 RepID=UPI0035CFBC1A